MLLCRGGVFFCVFGLALGFYDGFFGPGTGTFWVVAMIGVLGWQLKKAIMQAKVYNAASNVCALVWFLLGGHIHYLLGLLMSLFSMIGARIGARLVVQKNTDFVRPCFLSGLFILCLLLFYKAYC